MCGLGYGGFQTNKKKSHVCYYYKIKEQDLCPFINRKGRKRSCIYLRSMFRNSHELCFFMWCEDIQNIAIDEDQENVPYVNKANQANKLYKFMCIFTKIDD